MHKKIYAIAMTISMLAAALPNMALAEEYYTEDYYTEDAYAYQEDAYQEGVATQMLSGNLKLLGTVEVGSTLSADFAEVIPAGITNEDVTFEWRVDNGAVNTEPTDSIVFEETYDSAAVPAVQGTVVGTGPTYVIADSDFDQKIILTVTGNEARGFSGSLTVTSDYVRERTESNDFVGDTFATNDPNNTGLDNPDSEYTNDYSYESGYENTPVDNYEYESGYEDTPMDDYEYESGYEDTPADSYEYESGYEDIPVDDYEYESGYEDVPVDEDDWVDVLPSDDFGTETEQTFVEDSDGNLVEQNAGAQIRVESNSLDFGSLPVGYQEVPGPGDIIVYNDGTQDVTIIREGETPSFDISRTETYTIAAGESVTFEVFPVMGLSAGDYSESVVIYPEGSDSTGEDAETLTLHVAVYTAEDAGAVDVSEETDEDFPVDVFEETDGEQTVDVSEETDEDFPVDVFEETDGEQSVDASEETDEDFPVDVFEETDGEQSADASEETGEESVDETDNSDDTETNEFDISFSYQRIEFAALEDGYSDPSEQHEIEVTNNSDEEVTIAYSAPESFEVTAPDSLTISAGGSAEFAFKPALGVAAGDYSEYFVVYPEGSDATDSASVFAELVLHVESVDEEDPVDSDDAAENAGEEPADSDDDVEDSGEEPVDSDEETEDSGEEPVDSDEETEDSGEEPVDSDEDSGEEPTDSDEDAEDPEEEPVYENGDLLLDQEELQYMDLTEGYTEIPDPHDITVTNSGESDITLTYAEPEYFELLTSDSMTIAAGEMVTFTIQPKLNLEPSEEAYTETISFWAEGAEDEAVSLTAHVMVKEISEDDPEEPETDPSVEVSPSIIDFGTLKTGYTVPKAQTVTVKNTGDTDVYIRELLSTHYTVSEPSSYTIEAGKSITFTVQPNAGLPAGKYPENIYVYEDGSDTEAKALGVVTPTVEIETEEATYAEITVSPNGLSFGKETVGYAVSPTAQVITIENTGSKTVTLAQPVSAKYAVSSLSAYTLTPGSKALFAVKPKKGLPVGTHDEVLTIAGSDNVACNVILSFVVADKDVILQKVHTPANVSNVPNGVSKTVSGLRLPSVVTITTSSGTMYASVAWNVSGCDYDPTYEGSQSFKVYGTVTLPRGVTNPNNISLNTSVNVSVNSRTGYIASASKNWIGGIDSNTIYTSADKISFTAYGDGMSNVAPVQGDTRYQPLNWIIPKLMKESRAFKDETYTEKFKTGTAGNFTLLVTFVKQEYDGSTWRNTKTTDVKQVNFTVRAAGQGKADRRAVRTGDNTTILPYIIILIVAAVLIIAAVIIVLKRRKNK